MSPASVSFWWDQAGQPQRRPPLSGPTRADVAIVGAGYTGLWTAYALAVAAPSLRVAVCEAHHVGYGASGRNGGWVTAELPGSRARYAAGPAGRAGVLALQGALDDTVAEVGRVCRAEGIEAGFVHAGSLAVATNPAQAARLQAAATADASWGHPDTAWLDPTALAGRLRVAGALGATFTPHCARIQPAWLISGLAAAAERRGVVIFEGTQVRAIHAGRLVTAAGTLRAPVVLRATEGFTAALPGHHRSWLPMNSSLVVTEPLPPAVWAELGWAGAETLGDGAHAYVYAQRTTDGRIALGGRGWPYRFGSRTDSEGSTPPATVTALRRRLVELFPALAGVPIARAWSGVLGVPRDWCASVRFDAGSGLGHAGGYTGHGVAAANLAGRTLAELVLGRDSDLTRLPWVGHHARGWEPEPARWLGVHALYAAYRAADRQERGAGSGPGAARTSRLARVADRVSGRPR